MKAFKFLTWALMIALFSFSFASCSDSDNNPDNPTIPENPSEDPNDPNKPDPTITTHFDIWASIGKNSGMGVAETQLVKSVADISKGTLSFNDNGVDVTAKLRQHTIIKGKYYYQLSKDARFGKYEIVNDEIKIHAEFPFTTLKDRRFAFAWIDENILLLVGSNGASDKILWVKVDVEKMKIVAEGVLNLPAAPVGDKYSTSGLISYRASDNKLIYTYLHSKEKTHFFAAFVDPVTMKVEKVVKEDRAEFMAGTAYGELLQSKTFFDEKGDYYIACNNHIPGTPGNTQQFGTLLRIKKGTTDFDKSYIGFQGGVNGKEYSRGKIVTVEYLTVDKALIYIQDPKAAGITAWGDSYACYYAILDLKTDKLEKFNLPFSSGNFSQRSQVVGNKAYIGVNPEKEAPSIYIYDITTKKLEKGLVIQEGYSFDRILHLID